MAIVLKELWFQTVWQRETQWSDRYSVYTWEASGSVRDCYPANPSLASRGAQVNLYFERVMLHLQISFFLAHIQYKYININSVKSCGSLPLINPLTPQKQKSCVNVPFKLVTTLAVKHLRCGVCYVVYMLWFGSAILIVVLDASFI